MKSYGKPIESFTTVLQLLCTVRDAIAGHQCLVSDDLKILHRDVSLNNILLGHASEDSVEGCRGVLIDLDLAFSATQANPTVKVDHHVGTRISQSLSVLSSFEDDEREKPAYDYLDDLESFFWNLAYILLIYRPDGTQQSEKAELTRFVRNWSSECPRAALASKKAVMHFGRAYEASSSRVQETWGPVIFELFDNLRDWMSDTMEEKKRLLYFGQFCRAVNPGDPLEPLYACREEQYSDVLALFDGAIEALKEDPSSVPTCPSGTVPRSPATDPENHGKLSNAPTFLLSLLPPPPIDSASSLPPQIWTMQALPSRHQPVHSVPSPNPVFSVTSGTYAHGLYSDVIEERDIDAFLSNSDVYLSMDTRWDLPESPSSADDVLRAAFPLLSSIVQEFAKASSPGIARKLVNTRDVPQCNVENSQGYRISPVLLVYATGPSFEAPRSRDSSTGRSGLRTKPSTIGFSNMATYFSVKLDSELGSDKDILEEMASYAKPIFRDQPNRMHVRSLVLTEKQARLVHFDRCGAQISPPIDLHRHPATLVRLVAGLSSAEERLLGLDDSLHWNIADGKKKDGTLTTVGPSGDPVTYSIIEQIPTPSDAIRGRGTTCWRVQDPETLETFVGIPGVVQMVACDAGRFDTRAFRCPTTAGQYSNRVFTRVTMKSYGKPIEHFTSMLQLLCAIRDAIAGHQHIVGDDLKILHRDVSLNNILFGPEDAHAGYRGVLIDLDLAFRPTAATPSVKVDHNVGTHISQSLSVLSSFDDAEKYRPAHDYMDDLESFFWIVLYILLLYRPDGTQHSEQAELTRIVLNWSAECPGKAHASKNAVMHFGRAYEAASCRIQETWGPVCFAFVDSFRDWVADTTEEKQTYLNRARYRRGIEPVNPLEPFYSRRDQHYAEVLAFFDEAIEALKADPNSIPTHPSGKIPASAEPLILPKEIDYPTPPLELDDSLHSAHAGHEVPPSASNEVSNRKRPSDNGEPPDCPAKARRIKSN
ncbi:hypothetical protein NMY22_g4372 [Coprinellus aureogranulatus]|nr:hypothetical protein NMY22_g4372 [Coprinellus aureogranulatus]